MFMMEKEEKLFLQTETEGRRPSLGKKRVRLLGLFSQGSLLTLRGQKVYALQETNSKRSPGNLELV